VAIMEDSKERWHYIREVTAQCLVTIVGSIDNIDLARGRMTRARHS